MEQKSKNIILRLDSTFRLILLSIILGFVGVVAAQFFLWLLKITQSFLLTYITGMSIPTPSDALSGIIPIQNGWKRTLIPLSTALGGLISGILVYYLAPETEGHGTDAVVRSFHHQNGNIRARVPFIKALSSAITIGSGGSAGREGPIVQIGAGIGSVLARILHLPEVERRHLLLVGMSAGLAAIFKSPLGAAIFGVEILYSSMAFEHRTLLFTIIGSSFAYALTGLIDNWQPLFFIPSGLTFQHPVEIVWYMMLGTAAGAVATILPPIFYWTRDRFKALKVPPVIKPAIGGLLMGAIAYFLPQIIAGGYGWVQLGLDGKLPIILMIVLIFGKIISLSLTVSSGGSGGVFAPSLYIGAMVGGVLAGVLPGANPAVFCVLGMAAFFAGAARILIAPLIMVIEMTGGYHLIMPAMIAVSVSYMVQSGLAKRLRYRSLYEAQVPLPVNSPVHYQRYYSAVAALLRERKISLEDDIFVNELGDRFSKGKAVPLPGRPECLYTVELKPDAEIAEKTLQEIKLPPDVLIVGLLRGQETILPHGATELLPRDQLMVAASPKDMAAFRKLVGEE